jgi:hypothetical protein
MRRKLQGQSPGSGLKVSIKELSLWILFLLGCFGAGYAKGFFPSDSWPSLWGGPPEVEILVQNEALLPEEVKIALQKKLKIQIKALVVEDREAFNIRTITSPGYHLAIIPYHWIVPAALANQLSNFNPLSDLIAKKISNDFIDLNQNRIYGIPIYWVSTHLVKTSEQPPKKWFLIKDWDFIFDKMTRLKLDQPTITPFSFWHPPDFSNVGPAVLEVSHLAEGDTKASASANSKYVKYDNDIRSLYMWSLATPRHSPSRKISLHLAEELLDPELQSLIVSKIPVGTTLNELADSPLPRQKKASFIREIDLSQLKQPQWLGLEQVSILKNEFAH